MSKFLGDVSSKLKNYFNKGVEASKKGIESAGKAITDFSDKSVLQIELKQLTGKLKDSYAKLGAIAYTNAYFDEKYVSEVTSLCDEISMLIKDIKKHEKEIGVIESSVKDVAPSVRTLSKSTASKKPAAKSVGKKTTAAKPAAAKTSVAKPAAKKISPAKKTTAAKKSSPAKKTTDAKTSSAKKTGQKK